MNDFRESSTLNRMQERYWTTKQAVFKKLGKKDDDCIIASDAELDAKLELFQTIEESFLTLMRILENYQDRLCSLAQEENAMGRFLKENGKYDKTRAGKVMTGAGKALSFSAQQKLSLRLPLVRLYHEVETFQYRAIVDTLQTVERMEKARTAYRGALMWMKDASQQLDPDTCKQLEKFRKVQSNVRKTKARFDKLKLDTLQKVDLLSFSRCNLFSQALASYQNTLIAISEKMAQTMTSVAETTKGYQHYEFSTLKELTETSKKLAEKQSDRNENFEDDHSLSSSIDKDVLLFFESEYHDDAENKTLKDNIGQESAVKATTNKTSLDHQKHPKELKEKGYKDVPLVNISTEETAKTNLQTLQHSIHNNFPQRIKAQIGSSDLLTGMFEEDTEKSDLEFLNEILDSRNDFPSMSNSLINSESFSENSMSEAFSEFQSSSKGSCFFPSQLLNMGREASSHSANSNEASEHLKPGDNLKDMGKKGKQDMSSWYNLFADLDPLANPDLIGKKPVDDLNC